MQHTKRYFSVGLLIFAWGHLANGQAPIKDPTEEIRRLIPAATGMSRADFMKIATSSSAPKISDVKSKSFSLVVLAIPITTTDTKEQLAEFSYLDMSPRPSRLAKEFARPVKDAAHLVTAVHADRITDVTCNASGTTAKGYFQFLVPKLYSGKIEFVAEQSNGNWQITKLHLKHRDIHLVRGSDGNWTHAPKVAKQTP